MNKKIGVLVCACLAASVLLSAPLWHWLFLKDTEKLPMLILNKTAEDDTLREHKGITWLLNHLKKTKEDGTSYSLAGDYSGYVPASKKIRELPGDLSHYSHLYLADSYGVRSNKSGELIYGGMTLEEADRIQQSVKTNGQTIFAEFNTFAEPTEPEARRKLEDLFGLEWTGWTGRYFLDLGSDEVPEWVKRSYETQHSKTYRFSGQGLILVSEKEELMIVPEEDFGGKHPLSFSFTKQGKKELGLDAELKYNYWFDIMEPAGAKVLASYHLHVNAQTEAKLSEKGVPLSMPAVLHHSGRGYDAYYFAGDYADANDIPDFYQASGITDWKKLTSSDKKGRTDGFFWKAYVPMMKTILEKDRHEEKNRTINHDVSEADGTKLTARTGKERLQVFKEGRWQDILIKGVNMGIAKPGSFPGEAAISKSEYARWIRQIGELNANAIRIYTIHPPAFYEALYEYNQKAEEPIYLFHGVWAEEEQLLEKKDVFDTEVTEDFKKEMKRIVDLIHGNAKLAERPGHASGEYTADLSPYVLGWILGVEWDPDVVASTNAKHPDKTSFHGAYIKTAEAQPFEVWLSEIMNDTIAYEKETYHWTRPVSFTNWVTTDLLSHPSEPLKKEDMVSVDPNVMKSSGPAGLFASYHIYPYYPDFLNLEEKYVSYIDHRGEKNNYAGYLADLKTRHDMPLLAAEFGIPSSRGMTHKNVHGKHQGFHSEQEQGEMVSALFEDIVHENLAGGLIFSWQDEWFKRTWNTMDYDNPDRRPMWDNVQTNEQNFGLLDFSPGMQDTMIKPDGKTGDWEAGSHSPVYSDSSGWVKDIYLTSDEQGLIIRMDLQKGKWNAGRHSLNILFDTVPDQGQDHPPEQEYISAAGTDFSAAIDPEGESRLLIDSYYDTFYYHYGQQLKMIPEVPYANSKNNGIYHPIRLTLNKKLTINTAEGRREIPFSFYETGLLEKGNANPDDPDYLSLADYQIDEKTNTAEIRIPWLLLNMKDPSTREAMGDIWRGGTASSVNTKGIHLAFLLIDKRTGNIEGTVPEIKNEDLPKEKWLFYTWEEWNGPSYHERLKKSYPIVQKTFKEIE